MESHLPRLTHSVMFLASIAAVLKTIMLESFLNMVFPLKTVIYKLFSPHFGHNKWFEQLGLF